MKRIIILVAAACGLAGCNLGMAPSGGDTAEIERNFKAMPPQDRIKIIKGSPASPERKAKLIKDIENETGYHDPSDQPPAAEGFHDPTEQAPTAGGPGSASATGNVRTKGGQ